MLKRPLSLVAYESSDDELDTPDKPQSTQLKRRKLPPLSSTVTVPIPVDNPSLHQGRIRTVPHVDGQYASYVYVPLRVPQKSSLYKFLREVISTAQVDVPALHPIGIDVDDSTKDSSGEVELRISLTRPIYLRAYQREEVKSAIRTIARRITRFSASFAQFAELTNDERTRTFLTLEIGAGHVELKALSDAPIPILSQYRQQLFYDEPRFHASIAWALLSPPTAPKDTPHVARSQGGPSDKEASPAPPPAARDTKSAAIPAASHHEDEANAQNPGPVMSLRTTRSDTHIDANSGASTQLRNPTEFPTIPSLPASLVGSLQAQYGATLLARHVGVFDVDEVCVRIGKDVSRWRLAGE
ncbi:hypothetical protein EIP86_010613 [Pleurotus ostreatoroseus]|nr:hypothetical protein EIP86_010613 [Pleurotus ostreatoroseus]